jgi:hypothetical protein
VHFLSFASLILASASPRLHGCNEYIDLHKPFPSFAIHYDISTEASAVLRRQQYQSATRNDVSVVKET